MFDIDKVVQSICDAGISAMRRYAEISGEAPDDLPEYFMSSFVFDRIGSNLPMTLETRLSKLSEWNNDTRKARGLPPYSAEEEAKLLVLAEELRKPRVDMVLFRREKPTDPQDECDFLALVEFKKGEFSTDRLKLQKILPLIDTCPYGVTCGSLRNDSGYLEYHKKEAETAKDKWYQSDLLSLAGQSRSFYFCARLFSAA
jgi:hypothetical protein